MNDVWAEQVWVELRAIRQVLAAYCAGSFKNAGDRSTADEIDAISRAADLHNSEPKSDGK